MFMARLQNHILQWKHNRRFLTTIAPEFPDWIATVIFYTALQAVDTLLAFDKVPAITSHETRNQVLKRTARYSFIHQRYRPLYDISQTVRYLAEPAKWTPIEQIEANIVKRYLYPIETSVQKLIGEELGLPAVTLLPVRVLDSSS